MLGVWLVFLDLERSSARVLKLLWLDRAEEDRLACGEDVGFLFTAPLATLERRDIVGTLQNIVGLETEVYGSQWGEGSLCLRYGEGGLSGLRIRRLKLTGARPSFSNVRHGSSAFTTTTTRSAHLAIQARNIKFNGIASAQGEICIAFVLLLK